jgi:hypothetical protein
LNMSIEVRQREVYVKGANASRELHELVFDVKEQTPVGVGGV